MKNPRRLRIGSRSYTVVGQLAAEAGKPARLLIRGDHWSRGHTPSPFRWPPLHYRLEWEGSTAVLTSKI
jgi:hypothetical protein